LTIVWPILVFSAIAGWGTAGGWVARRVAQVELRPLQETLPLGLALVLVIAGLAVAFDAFNTAVVAAIVAIGAACSLIELGRWVRAWHMDGRGKPRPYEVGFGVLLVGAVLLLARWQTAYFGWNACDDDSSYLYLARRLVLRGDLLDPLNNRRASEGCRRSRLCSSCDFPTRSCPSPISRSAPC
jgi:hypothetical protein